MPGALAWSCSMRNAIVNCVTSIDLWIRYKRQASGSSQMAIKDKTWMFWLAGNMTFRGMALPRRPSSCLQWATTWKATDHASRVSHHGAPHKYTRRVRARSAGLTGSC
ncbi:uncharacterized protein CIMG_13483 [Coccidioides immitis RS]|uniref:Uncharacterized protein n=1 Tax=Coccidioides immitis (strain RS) TaxID=246410 RepID=A0A0D8JVS2_COCIM|nr:uncharacterized protein CIMG_13483 [Coccidioides immitis RS]KJF61204.1 hypothetical protein CIMG_13483 [Coccidioides immitis RS]